LPKFARKNSVRRKKKQRRRRKEDAYDYEKKKLEKTSHPMSIKKGRPEAFETGDRRNDSSSDNADQRRSLWSNTKR